MTPFYLKCHERLKPIEGWKSDHKADAGGLTVCGIARNRWPDDPIWDIWDRTEDKESLKTDSRFQAMIQEFYYREFWTLMKCDSLPEDLAWEMFEFGVNAGPGRAVIALQELLNVLNKEGQSWPDLLVDGGFGPKTLETVKLACRSFTEEGMARLLNMMQFRHYVNLVLARPGQEVFMPGWVKKRILYLP